jgi:hypothetical protein
MEGANKYSYGLLNQEEGEEDKKKPLNFLQCVKAFSQ